MHAAVVGAASGLAGAFVVDLLAFLKWKTWDEAHAFSLQVASLRWLQGAVSGALTGLGIAAV